MRHILFATAVLAVAIAGIISLTSVAEAVPTRFYGTVTVDGSLAPAGTSVTAEINGRDCGSGPVENRATTGGASQLLYVVDANSDSEATGCGGVGEPFVYFKVGTRYAAQVSCFNPGEFVEVNLTISGAATRPVPNPGQCGVTAPTPTPTPTPTPAPVPYSLSVLNLSNPCIPVSGQTTCDAARLTLWNGNQDAWTAYYQMQGLAAPTPDQVFEATLGYRIEAGDPATIGAIAEQLGWPHVRILAARYRGQAANELDEWVEVKNLGGGSQDMTEWSVRLDGTSVRWTFENGFVLQPGQACKFYTGAPMADACPGSSNIATSGVLPNTSGTLTLWVDWLDLKAIEARYNADPSNQPPPPNLQGSTGS